MKPLARPALAPAAAFLLLALAGCLSTPAGDLGRRIEALEVRLARMERTLNELHDAAHPEIRRLENQREGLMRELEMVRLGHIKSRSAEEIAQKIREHEEAIQRLKKKVPED